MRHERWQAQQFVKFCRVCQIIGSTISEARPALVEADIVVVYTAEVKRRREGKSSRAAQKMDFSDFLTSLMKLSLKVYPSNAKRSVDDAFQRLLLHNVLPLADRRNPAQMDITECEADPQIRELKLIFGEPLEQMFQFYASFRDSPAAAAASDASAAAAAAAGSTTPGRELALTGGSAPGSATRRGLGGSTNSMKSALGYDEFLKFAADFDLSNNVILSTLELGDIYLSSLREVDPDRHIRKLTFTEFWDALIRCSLIAYSKISRASPADKLKGLFLYMWRAINRSVPKAFSDRRNVSTYAGDLISGAMLFNKRFTALWAEDEYRDYLNPDVAPETSGRAVLRRLMGVAGSTADELAASARLTGLDAVASPSRDLYELPAFAGTTAAAPAPSSASFATTSYAPSSSSSASSATAASSGARLGNALTSPGLAAPAYGMGLDDSRMYRAGPAAPAPGAFAGISAATRAPPMYLEPRGAAAVGPSGGGRGGPSADGASRLAAAGEFAWDR